MGTLYSTDSSERAFGWMVVLTHLVNGIDVDDVDDDDGMTIEELML